MHNTCVQECVQANSRSRKLPIYQYLCVRGWFKSRLALKKNNSLLEELFFLNIWCYWTHTIRAFGEREAFSIISKFKGA